MKPQHAILLLLGWVLSACSGPSHKQADATPRRYAYPRVEALDSTAPTVSVGDLDMRLSKSATYTHPAEGWLDATYPKLGAKLHLSVTYHASANKLAEAIANRRQRISLNIGDSPAKISNFTAGDDWICEVVATSEGPATPVQFIAADNEGYLVNGAFVLIGATAPTDSLRPIVEVLEREAIAIINSLEVR